MWQALAEDLIKIFNEDAYISIVIDNRIKKDKDLNKALYTKIIYGVVEKKLYLDYLLNPYISGKRIKPYLKNILRIGVYSSFLNLKDYYAVKELVETVKKKDYKGAMFVNGVLRNYLRNEKNSLDRLYYLDKLSIKLSIPIDLIKLLNKQYPNKLEEFYSDYEGYNTYRINNLKINDEEFYKILDEDKIDYLKIVDGFLTKNSLIDTAYFKEGIIISQDEASMKVSKVLKDYIDKENPTILDCCSAPGSKSLYLASLLNNKANIDSCDIYDNKLIKIKENADKCGVTCLNIYSHDATLPFDKNYDYIICDVPCSGLGTINHKPDLKYRLTIKDIEDIKELQKKIINNVSNHLNIGGILQYSTCTINKEENEYLIKEFLNNHPNYIIISEEQILPSKINDGFYICDLKRIS